MKKIGISARFVVFFIILLFVTVQIYNVLSWKDTEGINGLYDCPSNNVDVLFVGSSHSYCTVNTALLWKDCGIAAIDISDGQQPFSISCNYLKEALKTQQPKIVFVELMGMNLELSVSSGLIYRNTLNMKWSSNYLNNLDDAIDNINLEDLEQNGVELSSLKKSILLKYPIVHSRYKEITEEDYSKKTSALRYQANWSRKDYPFPEAANDTGIIDLSEQELNVLDQLVALSREYEFKLILWVAPCYVNTQTARKYNAVEKYADINGIGYYNFIKMTEETGFDFSTDMRNESNYCSHMNDYGSRKITKYIEKIITETQIVPDRRGDIAYSRYDDALRKWDIRYSDYSFAAAKTIEEYSRAIDHDLFSATVIVYDSIETEPYIELLKEIGGEERITGLYTTAKHNQINDIWELSSRIVLEINENDSQQVKLYDRSTLIPVKECDICIIIINKDTGVMTAKAEFKISEGKAIKQ